MEVKEYGGKAKPTEVLTLVHDAVKQGVNLAAQIPPPGTQNDFERLRGRCQKRHTIKLKIRPCTIFRRLRRKYIIAARRWTEFQRFSLCAMHVCSGLQQAAATNAKKSPRHSNETPILLPSLRKQQHLTLVPLLSAPSILMSDPRAFRNLPCRPEGARNRASQGRRPHRDAPVRVRAQRDPRAPTAGG